MTFGPDSQFEVEPQDLSRPIDLAELQPRLAAHQILPQIEHPIEPCRVPGSPWHGQTSAVPPLVPSGIRRRAAKFRLPAGLAALVSGLVVMESHSAEAGGFASNVDNDWFRAWPPAGVTYSFPSAIRQGDMRLGDLDTLEFRGVFIQSLKLTDDFKWLVGADWYRLQASVPSGAPIPNTLQSAAAVVGFDWRFHQRWRVRLEVLPGVYSDFGDVSGDDFNAPVAVDLAYAINPNLLVGAQLSANAWRDSPLLGAVGVRWRFAEDWLLSLWFPRPRLEFSATDRLTFFAGATFAGGTFVVAEDFGTRRGRAVLDGQPVDFQEVRAGAGLRYTLKGKFGIELGGGWTIDRRYDFHEQDVVLKGDAAPYIQLSAGLTY